MSNNGHIALPRFQFLERTHPSLPGVARIEDEVQVALSGLALARQQLAGREIAVSVGSRGIASLPEVTRGICSWVKAQGGRPFVFPAMGSHGGGTAEGQRKILEEYGITADSVGAEVRSSVEVVSLGTTPEGFDVLMDKTAAEADGVIVMNRVKTHTGFSGKIESGLLKMIVVGMGKGKGATEFHRWARQFGFEAVIRAIAARVLDSGKILAGLGVVENQFHQIAAVRAARPDRLVAVEEEMLRLARPLIPRIPFAGFHVLMVDEMGKDISGTGMDTKSIGRGLVLEPGEAPEIRMIYVRDLTAESGGNAIGVGWADLIHERLNKKIDLQKTYLNAQTALNPLVARVPIHLPSDREALDLALGHLGLPDPAGQRVVWIKNTLNLNRIAISEPLVGEARTLEGWELMREPFLPQFDAEGNIAPVY
jgi:hypothetical protein